MLRLKSDHAHYNIYIYVCINQKELELNYFPLGIWHWEDDAFGSGFSPLQ
jgi:hypothetical protein